MKKVIDVKLSPAGVAKAISQLKAYKRDFIEKTKLFRLRFAERVKDIAEEMYAETYYEDIVAVKRNGVVSRGAGLLPSPTIPVNIETTDDYTAVVAGDVAVFIEFGAGVYYNGAAGSSPHPLGAGLGYTIGSYPPAPSKGRRKAWGFYEGDTVYITHGTASQRVLYLSVRYAQAEVEDIARKVFG